MQYSENKNFNDIKNLLINQKNEPKRPLTKKVVDQYPNFQEKIQKIQNEILKIIYLEKTLTAIDITKKICRIFLSIDSSYSHMKSSSGKLDYDDLIEITSNLLTKKDISDWVMFKLDGGIEHILLDEAQDTNPKQWEIIDAILEDFFSGQTKANKTLRTLFVVGDYKQSIYSFQGSDVSVFQKKQR